MPSQSQFPNRFTDATPQAISDIYDKLNLLLSERAAPTPTPAPVAAPAAAPVEPQFSIIPILTALPSNNPNLGKPYAQNDVMVIVNNQLWEYIGKPTYQWQQVGTATVLLADTAANLHNYAAATYPGALFFEVDAFALLRSNGTSWITVSGGTSETAITAAEWLTVTGTANAIIGTTATNVVTLVKGMLFRLVPTATNSGAVTLAVDGIAAKAVTKNGASPLSSGDLQTGRAYLVLYDGTQFQIIGNLPLMDTLSNWTLANYNPAHYPTGTQFIVSDWNAIYVSDSVAWHYVSGQINAAFGSIPTTGFNGGALGAHDTGLQFFDNATYIRKWQWSGSAWGYASGELPGGDTSPAIMILAGGSAPGWAICDGSTVTISTSIAGTASFVTPNFAGGYYPKGGAYSATPVATVDPVLATATVQAGIGATAATGVVSTSGEPEHISVAFFVKL